MTRGVIIFGVLCFIVGVVLGAALTLYLSPTSPAQQDANARLVLAQAARVEAEAEQIRMDTRAEELALPSVATVKTVSAWLNLFVVPIGIIGVVLVAVLWYRRGALPPTVEPTFTIPAMNFAREAPAHKSFVYVHHNNTNKAERDLHDVREFLERGEVNGFARADWVGRGIRFKSGHDCTRDRYEALRNMCIQAEVLEPDGNSWRLACSLAEALDCFSDGESVGPERDGTGQAG